MGKQLQVVSAGTHASCEACGREFSCGATLAGCWCAEVQLTERARRRLRELYNNCLCRECLESFAAEDARRASRGEQVADGI